MSPTEPKEGGWFEEFKKLNTPSPRVCGSDPRTRPDSASQGDPGSQRRRHFRFEIDESVARVHQDGFLGLFGRSDNLARAAIDISEGGAQFLVNRRVRPGTRIKLAIEVARFQDSVEATGVVGWCFQSARKKEDYYIGVEFREADAGRTRKISAMRNWFTSDQFKAIKQSRQRPPRDKPPEISFPG